MHNYIIKLEDGRMFGGWDFEGKIFILPLDRSELVYRMKYPLAQRTIEKVEEATGLKCQIEKIAG